MIRIIIFVGSICHEDENKQNLSLAELTKYKWTENPDLCWRWVELFIVMRIRFLHIFPAVCYKNWVYIVKSDTKSAWQSVLHFYPRKVSYLVSLFFCLVRFGFMCCIFIFYILIPKCEKVPNIMNYETEKQKIYRNIMFYIANEIKFEHKNIYTIL